MGLLVLGEFLPFCGNDKGEGLIGEEIDPLLINPEDDPLLVILDTDEDLDLDFVPSLFVSSFSSGFFCWLTTIWSRIVCFDLLVFVLALAGDSSGFGPVISTVGGVVRCLNSGTV